MVTVLVVDSSAKARTFVRETLTRSGYEILEAADYKQAWNHLRDRHPDLMLISVLMEHFKELEIASQLNMAFPNITMAVMTPISRQDLVPEALRCGAKDVLVKPLTAERLFWSLGHLLGISPKGRQRHRIPRVNWTDALTETIRTAGRGDTILVHTEAMKELARRAMQRMNRTDLHLEIGQPAESN